MEERKTNSPKANRILYAVVVGALCVLAVVIAVVAVANRPDTTAPTPTGTTTPSGTSGSQPNGTTPSKPTGGESEETVYLCPLTGHVARRHDPENFYYSPTMCDWRTHTGIDIAASLGDSVTAVADGIVEEICEEVLMGTCVSVRHDDGVVSIYKNLAPELASGIEVGVSVKAGDVLGSVGESAMGELADEAHLHFEMTQAGESVDPLSLLDKESCEASLTFDEEVQED